MPYLPFFIARRYLFAKKSHNVINIISAISVAGMAIGTAALVIILSVYNGFDSIVKTSLSDMDPDIMVTPSRGKTFVPEGEAFDWLYENEAILSMSSVLEDNVYLSYSGRNGIAIAKGVDEVYQEESPIRNDIVEGSFEFHKGDIPLAVVGSQTAYELGISPRFIAGIEMYFPSADRPFSLSNPAASLESVKVFPSGIYNIESSTDNNVVLVPLAKMRELLSLEKEVSGLELRIDGTLGARAQKKLAAEISQKLGPEYRVRDRYQQNESLYRMMRYEKASVFLILLFVIVIIAFNIFSSLSMLMIEKEEDTRTLQFLGAGESATRQIFILEGWMISLWGMLAGLAAGILIVLAQQHFGIVKMPSSFSISAYPVILEWSDILLTALSVAAIGYIIACLPTASGRHLRSRR